MKSGKQYIVGLDKAPTITPKEGSWAQLRYANGGTSTNVSIVLSTWSDWAKSIHIYALADGPDPTLNKDELVYRSSDDTKPGESRTVASFSAL